MLQNIESIYLDDDTHRHLIRLLVNSLYPFSIKVLDVGLLNHICGITFIIDQYVRARSQDAKDNLFAVIYDYITYLLISTSSMPANVHSLPPSDPNSNSNISITVTDNSNGNLHTTTHNTSTSLSSAATTMTEAVENMEQISLTLEVLKLLEAPQYFMQLFKVFPAGTGRTPESLSDSSSPSPSPSLSYADWIEQILDFIPRASPSLAAGLDRTAAAAIADAFAKLALFYNKVHT